MTKLLLIALFSFLVCSAASAQTTIRIQHDSVAFYMSDSHTMAHGQSDAQFLRLIIKMKGGLYEVQDYYGDGTLRLLAHSKMQQMLFEQEAQGNYTEYYRNGNKRFVRNYENGKLAGEDTSYYASGKLYNVVNHATTGDFLKICVNTTGKILAENGNGSWIKRDDDEERQTLTGLVINGKEDGVWIQRYADDTIAYKVEFKNGIIVPGTDHRPVKQIFTAVDTQPSFGKTESDFNMYLARNIRYPKYARENKITGRVIVTFVVERDGSLTEMKILRSPDQSLGDEALRVMKASPPWHPGMQGGRPVRVQFSVPVAFALGND